MRGKGEKRFRQTLLMLTTAFSLLLTACGTVSDYEYTDTGSADVQIREYESVADVPEYSGEPYVEINENQPEFTEEEITTEAFEAYSELDALGRCGEAEACIGEEIMPTEERGSISEVKPTGWKNEKYDNIDGEYLYNRCHLIGYQLSGENANAENLITGTRYMNTEGMLPFEDLVASGVQMEAESVEDDGKGVCFNVYVYNVQPDITIDYTTGDNWETTEEERDLNGQKEEQTYVLNKNTHKFHRPDCSGAADIKEKNREEFTGTREEVIKQGYQPCTKCKP